MFTLTCAAFICFTAAEIDLRDGDTFNARNHGWRLMGVDAPELNSRNRKPPEPGAVEATAALRRLIDDAGQIGCEIGYGNNWDRTVARCETQDGTDLACAMVSSGWARSEGEYSEWTYAGCEEVTP